MADIIIFDEEKERELQLKRLRRNTFYKFSRLVRASFIIPGEKKPRNIRIDFSGGKFMGYDITAAVLVFRGIPVCDPEDFGECIFWFDPAFAMVKLTAIAPKISKADTESAGIEKE